ncbi:MAG: FGGY-family carbohydrate kinase, partial [Catenibacillus sp.]|nr:FGGY-family carbohydrate kinase [Catenibacillus sp.]
MGCMLSAASCNQWWSDGILQTKDYAKTQSEMTRLGENHVFFLPYLMGERSPHNNPKARGTFIGMTMDTTRNDMTQAVMEGVIFGLRDSFEIARRLGLQPKMTKICGGGAKSALWRKMTANILGIPVAVVQSEEGPAMGAAMLAAVGTGAFKTVKEASEKIVKIAEIIEPDSSLVMKYEAKYRQFAEIYPTVRNIFEII